MLDIIIDLVFIVVIIFTIYHFVSAPKRERNKQNKMNEQCNQQVIGESINQETRCMNKND